MRYQVDSQLQDDIEALDSIEGYMQGVLFGLVVKDKLC